MERFTWKTPNGTYQIDDCLADSSPVSRTTCYDENFKNAFSIYEGSAIDKLGAYEDLEESLESAYGECEGFLKTSIEHLVKLADQEEVQEEIGHPHKARLLTDEDADEWLEYKRLKEQGRFVILPCKVGEIVWCIDSFNSNGTLANPPRVRELKFNHHLLEFIGKTVFLTKEEAEQALERRKNGKID